MNESTTQPAPSPPVYRDSTAGNWAAGVAIGIIAVLLILLVVAAFRRPRHITTPLEVLRKPGDPAPNPPAPLIPLF